MQTIKLLLIDDDTNYAKLTRRMLAHINQAYQIDWVETYREGLETMLRQEHDVYLLDYYLSSQSGLDLLQEAMAAGITAPIIIMTSQGEFSIDLKSLQTGAADYVDKVELKPTTLDRAIRYALERAQGTRRLRESEERYRSLIDEAYEGVLIASVDGTILYANARFGDMVGRKPEALVSTKIFDLLMDVKSTDDLPLEDKGALVNLRLVTRSGASLTVETSVKPVSGDRIQFIVRDVTSHTEAIRERDQFIEQLTILGQVDDELSQILNVDYVFELALDATVRLSGANAGFIGLLENNRIQVAQSLGYYTNIASDHEALKTPIIQRLIEDEKPRLMTDVSQEPDYVTISDQTKAQMLLPMMSYERMIGIINLETNRPERFTPETFDFLKLIAARVAVAIENAQLYKIAQDQLAQLQELYAQVSALEQLKSDMIRIAAHDLRNPVSVIMGYAQLMRISFDAETKEKYGRFIDLIERSANRMEKITTDILSLERIENLQSDPGAVLNLNELVSSTYKEYLDQAGKKSQVYDLHLPQEVIEVQADSAQLGEAISNLISNAIKYTPEQGTITVSLTQVNNDAVFKVEDTGFGIQEIQQANLFQPFFRARSKETEDIEGTGLGLYLIKNIIERYQGTMIFKSVYGQGSTFGFQLPVV